MVAFGVPALTVKACRSFVPPVADTPIFFKKLNRQASPDPKVRDVVAGVMDAIEKEGDEALRQVHREIWRPQTHQSPSFLSPRRKWMKPGATLPGSAESDPCRPGQRHGLRQTQPA